MLASPGPLVHTTRVHPRQWSEPNPPTIFLPLAIPVLQPISAHLPYFPDPLKPPTPLHGVHQLDNLDTSLSVIELGVFALQYFNLLARAK